MLKEWEKKLLLEVLDDVEKYDGDLGCNDWDFPDYMTESDKCDMVLALAYFNDGGKELEEIYDNNLESYLVDNLYISNFMVPFYFKCRLEEIFTSSKKESL